MNRHDDLDRLLSAWLEDPLVSPAPRYLEDILQQTRRTRQRPAWASLERWLPMSIALRAPARPLSAWPSALRLALVTALLLTLVGLTLLAGALISPAPEDTSSGGLIAFDRDGDIYVVDPPDGEPRLLVGGPTEDIAPLWSPDGQLLLFIRINGAQETLMVTDPLGAPPTVINAEPLWETSRFIWSPDSATVTVASAAGTIGGVPTISDFDAHGGGEVSVDGLGPWSGADMPAWRAAGDAGSPSALLYRSRATPPKLLLADAGAPDDSAVVLQMDDIDGGRNEQNGWLFDFLDPAWSPDGTRFGYHTLQDLDSVPDDPGFRVHIGRPSEPSGQTSDARIEYDPTSNDEFGVAWSPDGSRVAFQAVQGNTARLVVAELSAEDVATTIAESDPLPASDWHSLGYAWAPDGSSIALVDFGAPDRDAYLVDPQTGALQPLGWSADGDPSWQPAAS